MKIRNNISAAVMALTFCASCNVETSTVMFVEDNDLSYASDTVFSVLGILSKVQAVADRTVLLGELRGDLVSTEDQDLKAIGNFSFDNDSVASLYRDYYAIINNCNYFLANADSTMKRNNASVFAKERAVVSAYRAWTYLQLATNFSEVPFITTPLLSYSDIYAEHDKATLEEICTYFINDLEPQIYQPFPSYGDFSYYSNATFDSKVFFLPIPLLLGDLYLWRGSATGNTTDFAEAAEYYHEYLTDKALYASETFSNLYYSAEFTSWSSGWGQIFRSIKGNGERISLIPLAANSTYGRTATLHETMAKLEGSEMLKLIVDNAPYCYTGYDIERTALKADSVFYGTKASPEYLYTTVASAEPQYTFGDLRLYQTHGFEDYTMPINKYSASQPFVTTYRSGLVYLRLCEAICRAGYPQTAFVLLKYGLSRGNMVAYASEELSKLMTLQWTFYDFGDNAENIGMHARGCGQSEADSLYSITGATNAIEAVEDLLIDELALETAFEGNRYGDLMRFAMRRGTSFIADRVASRDDDAASLNTYLKEKNNWYLPSPSFATK